MHRDPRAAKAINFEAVVELAKLRSPSQLVIYPNTNSGYGIGAGDTFCTEDSPLEPISVYGRTKCDAELALLERKTSSPSGWRPCSAPRRGCGSTCW